MFGTIRKHSQALWIPIIIVIVISFVVYFTPGFDPLDNSASRRSETDDELEYARQQVFLEQAMAARDRVLSQMQYMPPESRNQLMPYIPGMINQALNEVSGRMSQMPPRHLMDIYPENQQQFEDRDDYESLDDYPALDHQAQLRMLRLKKARDLGIRVSLNTAVVRIQNMNMFSQPGSGFSQEIYTRFLTPLARAGFLHFDKKKKEVSEKGKGQFREFIREDIMMRQLDELMTRSSGFFPDKAVEASLIEANKKYTTQAIFFSSSNHLTSVTNAIDANSTVITNHYQTLTDQYRIPPKRVIGYVKVANANYLPAVEKEIEFDKHLTNRIKLHHSSTNSVEFFKDTNGTKKLPDGPRLIAAAQADIRKKFKEQFDNLTKTHAQAEATAFFEHIFDDQPEENWTLARLKQESAAWNGDGKQPLHYQESTVSRSNESKALPQRVINIIYGPFESAAKGTLYSRSTIEVSGDGYYLIGLVRNIAGRPRKFDELNDKEKSEVKESFINKESARLTEEDAHDFREGIEELMKTGQSFADSIRLSPNPTVILPTMKLNGTNQVAELKGLATVRQIQSAMSSNPEEVKPEVKPGWISEYTPAANNEKSDGFIVHVSAVEAGEPPTPDELREAAELKRQNVRRNPPNWLQADVQALNAELAVATLLNWLTGFPYQYEQASSELEELDTALSKINSGKMELTGNVTVGELQDDRQKAKDKLNTLKLSNTTSLPSLLKEANDKYVSLTGDNKKFTGKIDDALKKAKKFDDKLKAEEKKKEADKKNR